MVPYPIAAYIAARMRKSVLPQLKAVQHPRTASPADIRGRDHIRCTSEDAHTPATNDHTGAITYRKRNAKGISASAGMTVRPMGIRNMHTAAVRVLNISGCFCI